MSLTIQSGGSITLQGGSGGGGAISAVASAGYGPTSPHQVLSTTSSSYTTLADGISITVTTGTSVLISLSSWINSSAGTGARYVAVAVSGATTTAAAEENAIWSSSAVGAGDVTGKSWVLTGLTAGSNTFTLRYKTDAGTTGQFYYQRLVVQTLA